LTEEKTVSSQLVYEGKQITLRIDDVEKPDGVRAKREIVEHADCVAIVAADDYDILLVRQFRKPLEKELLEIPAGGIDPGESPEDAVKREMREETGFMPQKLVRLGGFYSIPGYGTEYLHLFLATDLVPSRLYAEDTGSISVIRIPVSEIIESITSGAICDGKSIAGLLTYLQYLKAL
jgi:ADP-ribose pyrophosphatase